ncbi:MAG: pyridoxal-phosphate dependent enzyme [Anaerolineae bacterium]|nr:pyridoxal-phosphate dependent enzyme [Anaerolineae bacterium]
MTADNCFVCDTCGSEYPLDTRDWSCPCGGLFELAHWPPFDPARIDPDRPGLWRYRHLLPLDPAWEPVSLGEVQTPLIAARWAGASCALKIESALPTGSFKDRGTALLMTALRGLGVTRIVEDSSGNAGASVAAYAARAGIAVEICVPHTSAGPKIAQMAAYGAEVIQIKGKREYAALAAWAAAAHGSYYASHVFNPFFLAGIETLAYELWEQLGRRAPAHIVLPVGSGTLLLGLYRGFGRLHQAGLVERLPRLVAVQAAVCPPIYHAFQHNLDDLVPVPCQPSIASGISIGKPPRGAQVLAAVRATGGTVLAVTEDEIVTARDTLARAGFHVEDTAAAAPAVLARADLPPAGSTAPCVLILTAHGLKTCSDG